MKTINIKLLTLVATFLVILLHTAAIPFSYFHLAWSVSVMYEALGRIAFPLFLLVAGYVSLNKNESLLSTLKTRVLELVIPLIAWSVIYIVYGQQVKMNHSSVSVLETRQRWHAKGGVTQQATRWWPVDPSEESMDEVTQKLNTRLKEKGCETT